jgi:hypothetical protein
MVIISQRGKYVLKTIERSDATVFINITNETAAMTAIRIKKTAFSK